MGEEPVPTPRWKPIEAGKSEKEASELHATSNRTDQHLQSWAAQVREQIRTGQLDLAITSAEQMYIAAQEAGSSGRRVQALGLRAEAHTHISVSEHQVCLDLLLEAEIWLATEPRDIEMTLSRSALATAYTELGFHELAVQHCAAAAKDLRELGAPLRYLAEALLNYGFRQLDWAIDLGHIGLPDRHERPDQLALLAGAKKAIAEHDALPSQAHGTEPHRVRRRQAVIDALLDPAADLSQLQEAALDDIGHPDLNERGYLLAMLAKVHRMLGEPEKALDVATTATKLLNRPGLYPTTRGELLYQLHAARLATGDPGAVSVDSYVKLCQQNLWEHRANSLSGFLARRDLLIAKQDTARAEKLAATDPLTGVHNRRALDAWMARHPTGPAYIVMIDIDNFKAINDTFGHHAGDVTLRRLARALAGATRPEDLLIRYGGDEFVIAGHTAPNPDALRERIADALDHLNLTDTAPGAELRASIGIATITAGHSTHRLIEMADGHMFTVKRQHRTPQ